MIRLIVIWVLLLGNLSCSSQPTQNTKLQQYVETFAADSAFMGAGIGLVVKDVATGKNLAQHNADLLLTPASCQKLLTTAAALELLSPDYQFTTQLLSDGKLVNGVLHGNLIIRGLGDPSLQSKYFERKVSVAQEIVRQLKSLSIHSIQGKMLVDNSYFAASIPSTWIWEDIGNYYGAVPHALNYRDNLYSLVFQSAKAGTPAKLVKSIPQNTGLQFENRVMSSEINRDLAYIFGGNTSNQRRIEGSIPQNRKSFRVKGAMMKPELALVEDLEKELRLAQIKIQNQSLKNTGDRRLLFELRSPRLADIVRETNQKSINLFADQMLFEIGMQKNGKADWTSACASLIEHWKSKKIVGQGIQLFDGSGLSHFNAISAQSFANLLYYMHASNMQNDFLYSLPVAGQSGTLKYFGKGSEIEGRWIAKTGSITGVRSYCGYLRTDRDETYAISIVINNYNCSSADLNNKLLSLLIQIYNS